MAGSVRIVGKVRFVYARCDANASYATYGTPHPAIGEHSDVITQFLIFPCLFFQ